MKIKLKSADGYKFTFVLPISFLVSKFFFKYIVKDADNEEIKKIMPEIIKQLKQYKKKNGRFVFLEILSKDNDLVKIII